MCLVSDAVLVVSALRGKLIQVGILFGEDYLLKAEIGKSGKKEVYVSFHVTRGNRIHYLLGPSHEGVSPQWIQRNVFPILDDLSNTTNC